jgi:hypothetical protein
MHAVRRATRGIPAPNLAAVKLETSRTRSTKLKLLFHARVPAQPEIFLAHEVGWGGGGKSRR